MAQEIEIKFQVADLRALTRKLRTSGFRLTTRSTHEMNTLYDLPGDILRNRRELLRIRKYGKKWTLTHKSKGSVDKHSSRTELETQIADGEILDEILHALGYAPTFRYEKFRAEWVDPKAPDGKGQVVVDETPIGNFCEIEGAARWIDATAKKLGVRESGYITKNYATLFAEWAHRTGHTSNEMTFSALGMKRAALAVSR